MSSGTHLKEIALAMHNYQLQHGHFPPAAVHTSDGRPLLSWRVLLLPYLGEEQLYKQFKLDEPWESPHNLGLLEQMPRVYAAPSTVAESDRTHSTYYQVFVGRGAAFEGVKGLALVDFTDGASKTFLVVEAGEAVPWTKPADLPYAPDGPLPDLGGIFKGGTRFTGLNKQDGFNAAFADGSVRWFLRAGLDESRLRGFITRNGGERVEWPD
jgi:prepilin-type processing-associated H-X9-DG protein